MRTAHHHSSQTPFCKMHALGNDFVILDARNTMPATMPATMPDSLAIRRIADRRHGIGCDQLLVLTKPTHKKDALDMTIFNPDASQAQACGNGTRCVARYVFDFDKNFQRNKKENEKSSQKLSLRVAGQRLQVERLSERIVAVAMGVPKFSATALGLTKACRTEALPLAFKNKDYGKAFGVSIGNPHAVFFCQKSDARIKQDLLQHGASLEKHPLFREGANISFARIEKTAKEVKAKDITLFVWERGAGNTHACGSAACATLVAGIRQGLLQREARVRMEGGDLLLAWQNDSAQVTMTGPADYAFFGTTHLLS